MPGIAKADSCDHTDDSLSGAILSMDGGTCCRCAPCIFPQVVPLSMNCRHAEIADHEKHGMLRDTSSQSQSAGDEATSELRRYGVLASIQLCDAYHKVRRLEEEIALLQKESAQCVSYCEERVKDLQNMLSALEIEQRPLEEVLGAIWAQSERTYFCASAFQAAADHPLLMRFPQAICAMLRSGIAEYDKHISLARQTMRAHPSAQAAPMQQAAEVQHGDEDGNDSMSDDSESGEV